VSRGEYDDRDDRFDDRDDDRRPRRRYDDEDDLDHDDRGGRPYRTKRERIARGKTLVRIPGVLMIIVALLGIGDKGWALFNLEESLEQQDDFRQMFNQPKMTPAEKDRQRTTTLVISSVGVAGAVLGLIGGICMVAVVGRGFCIASSVVAIIPALHGCCFLSTCVGVYALIMLLNADVKLAFVGEPPDRRRDEYDDDRRRDDYDDRDDRR
jgi:hypothetical protein